MAKWSGEGNDWIKRMAQNQPRKEDVIHSLLASMGQAVDKKTEADGTSPTKKPRELPPHELETPEEGNKLTLEIKGDCETIVDWVNGHAKLKARESTVAIAQDLLRDWWGRGVDLRPRIADWATHIFREHNKEADLWAAKCAKGREDEWVDTAHVAWSEVTCLCGFGDGRCDNGKCVAGIVILVGSLFTKTVVWAGDGSELPGC